MREPKNKGQVFVLASPDGREYRTSNEVEANELHRTRGYKFADTKTKVEAEVVRTPVRLDERVQPPTHPTN